MALVLVNGAAMAQETHAPGRVLPIPVILDGVQIPAHHELPDRALTFFVMKGGDTHRVVYAFSSRFVAAEFLRQLKEKDSTTQALTACSWPYDYSWFNKNPGCGGSGSITLTSPDYYTELDSIGWNNSISCVKAACNGQYTVIYSCRNFQLTKSASCDDPDRYYISAGDIISDLNTVGMNNRTSSIRFE